MFIRDPELIKVLLYLDSCPELVSSY